MTTPLNELHKSTAPLTVETIADALGYSPATIRRVIAELSIPAAYFTKCYDLRQVRIMLNQLNAEQLDAIEQKGQKHGQATSHQLPHHPCIDGASESYRASLAKRREDRDRGGR